MIIPVVPHSFYDVDGHEWHVTVPKPTAAQVKWCGEHNCEALIFGDQIVLTDVVQ